MAFLVLLMVSMAALTRVETQIAANYQQLDKARGHALTALNIALGQLQKSAGPDQRVTTTAQAFATDSTGSFTTATNGAKLWTGVWGNDQSASVEPSYSDPASTVSTPKLLNWLVSGNEAVTFSASTATANFGQITQAATGLAFAPNATVSPALATTQNALTNYTIGSAPGVLLVGPKSCGVTTGAESGYVVAPLVEIKVSSSLIPGLGGSTPTPIGRYAYWVGDEGVKARINLQDAYNPATATTTPTDAELRTRVQVAQRVGTELIDDDNDFTNGTKLKAAFPQDSTAVTKLLDANQLPFIGASANDQAVLSAARKLRFHDLTTYSNGVLTDTLRGGLRQDLTAAFKPGTTAADAPTGPVWQITTPPPNLLAWSSNPLVGYDGKGPPWQLLRSFYQLADATSGSGTSASINPIAQSGDASQHGVSPVAVMFHVYVEAKIVSLGVGDFALEMRHIPAIVLYNPYNITLRDAKYHVNLGMDRAAIFYARVITGTTATFNAPAFTSAAHLASPYFYDNSSNTAQQTGINLEFTSKTRGVDFTLQSGDMAPGTAYVYALDADFPTTLVDPGTPALTRGWGAGAANGKGILVTSASFKMPALTPDTQKYFFVFYTGGANGNGTGFGYTQMPTWDDVPASDPNNPSRVPQISATLRMASATGALVQNITGLRSLATAAFTEVNGVYTPVPATNAQKDLENAPATSTTFTCSYTMKVVLQATTIPNSAAYSTHKKIRWAEGLNVRARLSNMPAYAYYGTNPSFERRNASILPGAATSDSVAYPITADPPESGGAANFGYDFTASSEGAILFDIPRPETRLLSIGALQHVNAYREESPSGFSNIYPANAIGNSRMDLQVGPDTIAYATPAPRLGSTFYDHSYLFNRSLWDRYFFSGVPATGAIPSPLPNSRLVPAPVSLSTADLRTTERAAAGLLTTGAFNINSTSVEAWRAVLAGALNVPVGSTARTDEAPFPRTLYPPVDSDVMTAGTIAEKNQNSFKGYRFLTMDQLDSIATAIVAEVKNRGPFVCLADFVNRALVDNPATPLDERSVGALARALDATQQSLAAKRPNGAFSSTAADFEVIPPMAIPGLKMPGLATTAATQVNLLAQGLPGWVTQADVLQTLGPVLTARSDTFVIRTYGDVVDPVNSTSANPQVQSRAWCEAVVQRLPDYVDATSANQEAWQSPDSVNLTNKTFGRRFKIISFKWLGPSDI